MAGAPLPSLLSIVGTKRQPSKGGAAKGQLPSLKDVAPGLKGGGLPSLKDLVANKPGAPSKGGGHKGGSGGILGALEGGAHWVAGKAGLAAHDVKAIPGGIVHLAEGVALDIKDLPKNAGKGISAGFAGSGGGTPGTAAAPLSRTAANLRGMAHASVTSVEHPLRDPFQTAMTVLPILSGGASVAARAGAVAKAAREGGAVGDLAKAAVRTPALKPRLIRVGDEQLPLHPSKNPAMRAVQALHDKVVQKAIDTNPEGKLASYGTKRVGGSLAETARYQQRLRDVPAQLLEKASKRLAPTGGKLPGSRAARFQRVEQAALELTSVNTAPRIAAAYHLLQARKGVAPELNRAVAQLYKTVDQRGLLTANEHGDVIVNAADHPALAQADVQLAHVQGRGDEILTRYGVRSPEALKTAVDAPGKFRAGATFERSTPGKEGVPSQGLLKARARVTRLEALHERAVAKSQTFPNVHVRPSGTEVLPGPKTPGAPGDLPAGAHVPTVERLGGALSVARDELARLEQQAAGRVTPTGVVGGDTARPGRGHVSYAGSEPRAPKSPAASAASAIVGEARAPITSHANEGVNIGHGIVPSDVSGQAARHFRQIVRFVNTTEHRNQAIKTGSDARRSSRDVLVRVPGAEHAKIPAVVSEILGKTKVTHDDVAGINAALNAYREDMIPGLRDRFAGDRQLGIGTPAPEGHRWVDRNILGDLAKPAAGPRGRVARTADTINSAVTAATVYFKIGHIGTRVLTNASTNIIQGSAGPLEIAQSVKLFHAISEEDQLRALAAAGQHGFHAMPHEGQNLAGRVATVGANWWAKHADAMFRFNSIAYEARKAGFDTPAKFHDLLNKLENPHAHNLNAAQAAKVDWVAKRANREGIAYDRLSEFERRYLTRAVWFYPWLRGTVGFAANTALEHPYKAGALASTGAEGRHVQEQQLGTLPSYEQGLFQLKGGERPLVADFSTFSPFATPADITEAVARPAALSGFLNPAAGAGTNLIFGLNASGGKSTSPLKDAAASLASPTPEAQIITAFLQRHKNQNRRMFPKSSTLWGTRDPLLRALVGPGMPRRLNPSAAHRAAGRERSGR